MSSMTVKDQDTTIIFTSTSAPSVFYRPKGTRSGLRYWTTLNSEVGTIPNPYGEGDIVMYWPIPTTSVVVFNDANPIRNKPTKTCINRAINV
jgi:hypothetical protein